MKLRNIIHNSRRPVPSAVAVAMSSSSSSSTSSSASSSLRLPWLPSNEALTKLFVTGATVGPVVDSLHNQCLLEYHKAPISIPYYPPLAGLGSSSSASGGDAEFLLFCSSWTVPPLLGIAYVVLGGILPRVTQKLLVAARKSTMRKNNSMTSRRNDNDQVSTHTARTTPTTAAIATATTASDAVNPDPSSSLTDDLQTRALLAVATTALIIKFSQVLETHHEFLLPLLDDALPAPFLDSMAAALSLSLSSLVIIAILAAMALLQWAVLDGTGYALLVATAAAVGGPLAELPFVAADVWQYLPQAADYFPLQNIVLPDAIFIAASNNVLGGVNYDYQELALSSITGPCYFAVTMDAIALGRWFDEAASSKK